MTFAQDNRWVTTLNRVGSVTGRQFDFQKAALIGAIRDVRALIGSYEHLAAQLDAVMKSKTLAQQMALSFSDEHRTSNEILDATHRAIFHATAVMLADFIRLHASQEYGTKCELTAAISGGSEALRNYLATWPPEVMLQTYNLVVYRNKVAVHHDKARATTGFDGGAGRRIIAYTTIDKARGTERAQELGWLNCPPMLGNTKNQDRQIVDAAIEQVGIDSMTVEELAAVLFTLFEWANGVGWPA